MSHLGNATNLADTVVEATVEALKTTLDTTATAQAVAAEAAPEVVSTVAEAVASNATIFDPLFEYGSMAAEACRNNLVATALITAAAIAVPTALFAYRRGYFSSLSAKPEHANGTPKGDESKLKDSGSSSDPAAEEEGKPKNTPEATAEDKSKRTSKRGSAKKPQK